VRKLQVESNRASAVEIVIRLENGERRAIVQDADGGLKAGQRVKLVTSGGVTRITP
jgi:outer membrane lipoprotein SlyB